MLCAPGGVFTFSLTCFLSAFFLVGGQALAVSEAEARAMAMTKRLQTVQDDLSDALKNNDLLMTQNGVLKENIRELERALEREALLHGRATTPPQPVQAIEAGVPGSNWGPQAPLPPFDPLADASVASGTAPGATAVSGGKSEGSLSPPANIESGQTTAGEARAGSGSAGSDAGPTAAAAAAPSPAFADARQAGAGSGASAAPPPQERINLQCVWLCSCVCVLVCMCVCVCVSKLCVLHPSPVVLCDISLTHRPEKHRRQLPQHHVGV